jgi:hypothetical protein
LKATGIAQNCHTLVFFRGFRRGKDDIRVRKGDFDCELRTGFCAGIFEQYMRVLVPTRQTTGGINSLESISGLHGSLKLPPLDSGKHCAFFAFFLVIIDIYFRYKEFVCCFSTCI